MAERRIDPEDGKVRYLPQLAKTTVTEKDSSVSRPELSKKLSSDISPHGSQTLRFDLCYLAS